MELVILIAILIGVNVYEFSISTLNGLITSGITLAIILGFVINEKRK